MKRSEVYRERKSLEEFGVDEKGTLNKVLFDALFKTAYMTKLKDGESKILGIFNDAYYICTLILLDKRPYFKVDSYVEIASKGYPIFPNDRAIIVLSLVTVYLNLLDYITEDICKTVDLIESKCSGFDDRTFECITSAGKYEGKVTCASIFSPCNYPEEEFSSFWVNYDTLPSPLNEICNKTTSNIEKIFDDYEKEKIAEIANLKENNSELVKEIEELKRTHKKELAAKDSQMKAEKKKMTDDYNRELSERSARFEKEISMIELNYQQTIIELSKEQGAKALEQNKNDDAETKKTIAALQAKIETLRDKLGKETVFLKDLVEGLKEYAKIAGIDKAFELFLNLNYVLMSVPAWAKNAPDLKKFFIDNKTPSPTPSVIVSGDYVVEKQVSHEVNGVAAGGTGVKINKNK
ncbi:MAG: hypothetical protein K6C10_06320 [Prevotella sp.]|nr:hypothetical protein [Prevotella sp.]